MVGDIGSWIKHAYDQTQGAVNDGWVELLQWMNLLLKAVSVSTTSNFNHKKVVEYTQPD